LSISRTHQRSIAVVKTSIACCDTFSNAKRQKPLIDQRPIWIISIL
jgi:hypothetical protein